MKLDFLSTLCIKNCLNIVKENVFQFKINKVYQFNESIIIINY